MELTSPHLTLGLDFSGVFMMLMIFVYSSINKPFTGILWRPGPESTSIDDLIVTALRTMWVRESPHFSAKPTQKPALSSLSEGKC